MPATLTASDIPTAEELAPMTAEAIHAIIGEGIGLTVRGLKIATAGYRELVRRGVDVSQYHDEFGQYLARMAAGTVTAEAVHRFIDMPMKLRAVASLPAAEQIRLAAGDPITVVVKDGDTFTKRLFSVAALGKVFMRQVFAAGRIRNEQEQIAILAAPTPVVLPRKPVTTGRVTADRAQGILRVGTNSAPITEVVEVLRKIGFQISEARTR